MSWIKHGAVVICLAFCLAAGAGCISISRGPELIEGSNTWHTPPGTVITRPNGETLTVDEESGVWARRDVWESYQ